MENHTTLYNCLSCDDCEKGVLNVCGDAVACYIQRNGFFCGGYIERGCILDNKTDLLGKYVCYSNYCNWNESDAPLCASWVVLYVLLTLSVLVGYRYMQRRSDFKRNGAAMIPRFRRWEWSDSLLFWGNNLLLLVCWIVFVMNQCYVFF